MREFSLNATQDALDQELAEKLNVSFLYRDAAENGSAKVDAIAKRMTAFLKEHPHATNRELRDNCTTKHRGERPLFQGALAKARQEGGT